MTPQIMERRQALQSLHYKMVLPYGVSAADAAADHAYALSHEGLGIQIEKKGRCWYTGFCQN